MFLKEKQAFKFPLKSQKKEIPMAQLASNQTTVELVQEHETDAPFFRELEADGIFLNEKQLEAVRTKNGPYLVLAGAGSGKTRVLTCRTAYLLTYVENLKPEEIMLVTFTRKAANEMLERMKKFRSISSAMAERIVSGTFHSIFLKLLRSNGYKQEILSNEKYKEILVKQILREMKLKEAYEPETILNMISSYKSQMLYPQKVKATTPVEKEIKEIYHRYEKVKESKNQMDFDDILLESYQLLKNNDDLRIFLQKRFKYISVDEYQDTNTIQHALIRMILNPDYNNLFVVGDSDQTIYSFRNADVRIILNLEDEFPDMTRIVLDTNYRSNASIVGLGNEVIKHNKKRIKKTLNAFTESDITPLYMRPSNSDNEARMIVDNILAEVKQGNRKFKDHAILYRMHSLSRAIFDELVARNTPFIVHGNNQVFYLNSLIKPILDHMRLSLNPNNLDAIAGICPTMYLNKDKVGLHITSNALSQEKKDYLALLLRMPGLKPYHQGQVLNRIEYIRSLKTMEPKKAIQFIRTGPIRYDEYLELDERKTLSMHKEVVQETLDELESASDKFSTIEEFIHFVDKIIAKHKEMENLKKNPHADAIHLMTLHSAKGLEFPVVFLLGVVDGVLPHKSAENADEQKDRITVEMTDKIEAAIEEERRLLYVGITRAEKELYLSSPKKHRGKDAEISRFLLETFN